MSAPTPKLALVVLAIAAIAGATIRRTRRQSVELPVYPAELQDVTVAVGGGRDAPSTRAELYATARRLGIEGRSRMTKEELQRAIEQRAGMEVTHD